MRSILCVLGMCAMLCGADAQLFDAIRNGDTAKVQAMLKSGADPNQRHETGATALMYAAGVFDGRMRAHSARCRRRGEWIRQQRRHCSHVEHRRFGQGSPAAGTRRRCQCEDQRRHYGSVDRRSAAGTRMPCGC